MVSDGQAYSHAVQVLSQSAEDLVLGGCRGVGDFVGIGVLIGSDRRTVYWLIQLLFFFSSTFQLELSDENKEASISFLDSSRWVKIFFPRSGQMEPITVDIFSLWCIDMGYFDLGFRFLMISAFFFIPSFPALSPSKKRIISLRFSSDLMALLMFISQTISSITG
jgi:hypothetical protein